jgi:hypothetical protein
LSGENSRKSLYFLVFRKAVSNMTRELRVVGRGGVGQGPAIEEVPSAVVPSFCIKETGVRVFNYSGQPEHVLRKWIPRGLRDSELVILPDACPGKSPLPTGSVVRTTAADWRKFAVSDCGCGMQLLQSDIAAAEFKRDSWDSLGMAIARNKGSLGDLGGGNHFLDALVEEGTNRVFFLIHTGSRTESGLVDQYVSQPERFDREFARVVAWARHNRDALASNVRSHFGRCELVSDLPHNTYEQLGDGAVVIRKGANKVTAGERCILPSSMAGDVVELEATARVSETFDSLSHGTGRAISRSEAKDTPIDFVALRAATYIPDFIRDDSLRTDGPLCYRRLDECLELLTPVAREVRRFKVVAYLGHLP